MFEGETVLSIFFKLLNFGILIGLGVYVFKRYLLPSIGQEIAENQEALQQLQRNNEQLKEDQKKVEARLDEQAALCLSLGSKIERWKLAHDNHLRRQQESCQQLRQKIEKKVAVQEQNLAREMLNKKVLPGAIVQAQELLQKTYESESEGRQYILHVMKYLERGKI